METMKKLGTALHALGALVALGTLATASGCAGSGPSASYVDDTLMLASAPPLAAIAPSAWEQAPPDCEGLVPQSVAFRLASLSAGLIACVDETGSVVCVDTVEDISSDLDETGRDEEADALDAGYLAAAHADDMQMAIILPVVGPNGMAQDPEPQPNSRPRGLGDPEPQPN